ncbi:MULTISPECIES: ATP-binding protein [unclassified Streptomyces]|uniref:ATP-binding protein n=1 Tax=unclassified Streptomyces TaxID=2593676 RepID=UPI0022717632|nr:MULTISPECIES: ATP-binding protein [unclassified Streptomyces]MCY0916843.1 ATP-binding protein [Streptomyces sp. H27-G5]MCY0958001.1 ATP-binding protein [Streptomyces sp. H27-H5]
MTAPAGSAGHLVRVFTQRFSSTPRGARLGRRFALLTLHDWGIPHRSELSDDAALLVAELAGNAVTHGRVPGRDFELRMALLEGVLRIEVSDARAGGRPAVSPYVHHAEGGHGLRLVAAVAHDWGVVSRTVGKTVWAELVTPTSAAP